MSFGFFGPELMATLFQPNPRSEVSMKDANEQAFKHQNLNTQRDGNSGEPNDKAGYRSGTISSFQTCSSSMCSILMALNVPGGSEETAHHLPGFDNVTGSLHLTARGGRVRSTTPAEDRYIVLSAKRNRRTTAQQVANQFLAASGKQISRKTVAGRLSGGGLHARRPVVCVPLTRQHRNARLQWCHEHHNWTEQDWACVLFSDESRFSLSSDCRRQLIWRESGTAHRPENIQEKDRYLTCSIMV
ncbi:transposable element Tcb1 transposase [Trichonephila clavipes]|nr:transposable element Tcb1 transposase [Trichonephila clavipes]